MVVPVDEFSLRGRIRVVPKLGGGVRADVGWPQGRLRASRTTIILSAWWPGTLVVNADNLATIKRWRYGLNRGIEFDTVDHDELWIFQPFKVDALVQRLTVLGWIIRG
jgi:hypothetical protein